MFDKLVVSTAQRRRGRTIKFFLGTVVVYLSAVATAIVLSIFLATPQLAESELVPICIGRVPAPRAPNVAVDHPTTGGTPSKNLNNFRKLEDMIEHPQVPATSVFVPAGTNIRFGDSVIGGDPNAQPNIVGVIGGELRTSEPPPRPPDLPKPTPRTTVEDTRPLRVTSVVLQGKATARVVPVYPELPRRIRMPGEVSVEVIISPDGRVESTRVVSGHPMFVTAALQAARGWRFEPTLLNGVAVRVTGVITFVFKLNE